MKHQWLAYLVVALLSIGAGVAIAGLPNDVPVNATIIPPTSTVAPEPTEPATTAPATTVPATTTTTTTTTDPEPADTTDPDTTDPDTTDPDTTDPDNSVPAELPDRAEIVVAAANGANVAGAALRMADRLAGLGYVGILPLNGTDIEEFTTVYFADGFEEAALRMAEDLDLLLEFVAPIEDSPGVADLPADTELLVYIGRDRA
jgi:hypothetical protein